MVSLARGRNCFCQTPSSWETFVVFSVMVVWSWKENACMPPNARVKSVPAIFNCLDEPKDKRGRFLAFASCSSVVEKNQKIWCYHNGNFSSFRISGLTVHDKLYVFFLKKKTIKMVMIITRAFFFHCYWCRFTNAIICCGNCRKIENEQFIQKLEQSKHKGKMKLEILIIHPLSFAAQRFKCNPTLVNAEMQFLF